ncbi:hypothetical protein WR25_14695 [Diploscapter pachys]|uniref:Spindle assembly checkpoint component MAD1 n=1 Tax=Diploscapter pachys TaxID=2018661 RepID=A0A2A2KNK2_9BILA|nr:hypothetical protein WR25_14695 [Diploscapter pachys]
MYTNFSSKKFTPPEETDSPSEATMLFNKRAEVEFKRAFPLRKEKEQALRPPERRTLNFDDTLQIAPDKFDPNAQLLESKQTIEVLKKKIQTLENEKQNIVEKCKIAEERVDELVEERKNWRMQSFVQPAKPSPLAEPTDAGDSTRILHWACNPLDLAHKEMMEEEKRNEKENRKRRTNSHESDCFGDCSAKREKDEIIERLEAQLIRKEREKDNVLEYQNRTSRKFREIVEALTGFEFKLRDAETGEVEVRSIYNKDEGNFLFKYDEGQVDLMESNTVSSSQSIENKWAAQLRRYLIGRGSIPAFLASVTLKLESDKDFEEPTERTHTYSVLHHE